MHRFSAHSFFLLCSIVAVGTLSVASPIAAQDDKDAQPEIKTVPLFVRSMKITRTGKAYARPNIAIISIYFEIEGKTLEEVQAKQETLIKTYADAIKPFDPKPDGVYVDFRPGGFGYFDGKTLQKHNGFILVRTRVFTKLKEIGNALDKAAPKGVTLRFECVADEEMQETFTQKAQENAVAIAKKQAHLLAKAAGTRVISVLGMSEEDTDHGEPSYDASRKPDEWKIPERVLVANADMIVDFELAAPENDRQRDVLQK